MDPITISILTEIASGYFVNFSSDIVKNYFRKVFKLQPSLEKDLKNAKSHQDFERIFKESIGVIDEASGSGSIDIDHGFLEAIRGIRFDHQNGTVTIQGSTLKAPILQTGGTGSGETNISGSNMKSRGTEIKIGKNAAIRIKGNAQIRQN